MGNHVTTINNSNNSTNTNVTDLTKNQRIQQLIGSIYDQFVDQYLCEVIHVVIIVVVVVIMCVVVFMVLVEISLLFALSLVAVHGLLSGQRRRTHALCYFDLHKQSSKAALQQAMLEHTNLVEVY